MSTRRFISVNFSLETPIDGFAYAGLNESFNFEPFCANSPARFVPEQNLEQVFPGVSEDEEFPDNGSSLRDLRTTYTRVSPNFLRLVAPAEVNFGTYRDRLKKSVLALLKFSQYFFKIQPII